MSIKPRTIIICVRALQGIMAAASIALTAYVVNWHLRGSHLSTPPSINFLLFCPVFTLASVLYIELTPRLAPRAIRPRISLGIEATNCILYFSGFIAVAICLGDLAFCNGPVCMAGRGAAVLAAVQFSLWMFSAILATKEIFKGGSGQIKLPGRGRGTGDVEL